MSESLVPDPRLVSILADMVEAALKRNSGQGAGGVQCATKATGAME